MAEPRTRTQVGEIDFRPAEGAEVARGLLGWASFSVGALLLEGVAVRRCIDGRHTLSYPRRFDRNRRGHHVVRPVDDVARRAIEAEVFERLRPLLGGDRG